MDLLPGNVGRPVPLGVRPDQAELQHLDDTADAAYQDVDDDGAGGYPGYGDASGDEAYGGDQGYAEAAEADSGYGELIEHVGLHVAAEALHAPALLLASVVTIPGDVNTDKHGKCYWAECDLPHDGAPPPWKGPLRDEAE